MNGLPRSLDKHSWSPIPIDFPAFKKFGFKPELYFPKGRYKVVSIAKRG